MEKGWKVLVVAGLVAIIVVAVVFIVWFARGKAPTVPDFVQEEKTELIDKDSLELITKTFAEWRALGGQGGLAKNPNTGKYTMAPVVVCPHCKQKVPFPVAEQRAGKLAELDYKCPRCGEGFAPALGGAGR